MIRCGIQGLNRCMFILEQPEAVYPCSVQYVQFAFEHHFVDANAIVKEKNNQEYISSFAYQL